MVSARAVEPVKRSVAGVFGIVMTGLAILITLSAAPAPGGAGRRCRPGCWLLAAPRAGPREALAVAEPAEQAEAPGEGRRLHPSRAR